jgi:hypothetical protein
MATTTTLSGVYGSKERPYVEHPFDPVVRIGGVFAVLTVTVLASKIFRAADDFQIILQSTPSLTPPARGSIGPYGPGDPIPWTDDTWKGVSVSGVTFYDQSPIEVIDTLPDGPPAPVGPATYEVCLDAGEMPSHNGVPYDSGGASYYNFITDAWGAATSAVAGVVAAMTEAGGNPGASFNVMTDITGVLAAAGGPVADSSPTMPSGSRGTLYPPIGVQYMIAHWTVFGGPPPSQGTSATSALAYVQWNSYDDAMQSLWYVLALTSGSETVPGDALVTMRLVYLIDFSRVHVDGYTEVVVSQGWQPLFDPSFGDPGYHNTYRLQIYGTSNFVAGSDQTVTVATKPGPPGQPPVPVAVASYDVTKTVAWNDGAEATHPVLHFNTTGWLK